MRRQREQQNLKYQLLNEVEKRNQNQTPQQRRDRGWRMPEIEGESSTRDVDIDRTRISRWKKEESWQAVGHREAAWRRTDRYQFGKLN